jgi:predicted transcriptional regulator
MVPPRLFRNVAILFIFTLNRVIPGNFNQGCNLQNDSHSFTNIYPAMIAEMLISDSIPSVSLQDSGSKVLSLMDVFRVSHLPVVDGRVYLGVISDKVIFDAGDFDEPLKKYSTDNWLTPHVHPGQHIFEVAAVASGCGVSIVPVLSEDHSYLGSILKYDLCNTLTTLFSPNEPGGILELVMCEKDYSLSQITQIIEGNDAHILSLYTWKPAGETTELNVTIKVNKVDLSGIIQTLSRYNYNIKATFMDQTPLKNLIDDRFDQFMRYMNP